MNYLLLSLLLWLGNWRSYDQISQQNLALKEAETAYHSANYSLAVQRYRFLIANAKKIDPLARLNLGHSLFKLKHYQQARQEYERVVAVVSPEYATAAITQLGVIACIERDSTKALIYFREAMLVNPADEIARFNYELVRQLYKEPLKPPATHKSQLKPKPKTQENQAKNAAQQAVNSDQQKEVLQRFRSLNITEEQAMQLLNAMRDDDLPYELARRRKQPTEQTRIKQRW